jgi:hypothetical protein
MRCADGRLQPASISAPVPLISYLLSLPAVLRHEHSSCIRAAPASPEFLPPNHPARRTARRWSVFWLKVNFRVSPRPRPLHRHCPLPRQRFPLACSWRVSLPVRRATKAIPWLAAAPDAIAPPVATQPPSRPIFHTTPARGAGRAPLVGPCAAAYTGRSGNRAN